VTRFRITMPCVEATRRGGKFAPGFYAQGRWVRPEELSDYPVSAPQRKLLTGLADPRPGSF
jgi:A/G-specific adenine glycosylase